MRALTPQGRRCGVGAATSALGRRAPFTACVDALSVEIDRVWDGASGAALSAMGTSRSTCGVFVEALSAMGTSRSTRGADARFATGTDQKPRAM
jgi:hypothetical protein